MVHSLARPAPIHAVVSATLAAVSLFLFWPAILPAAPQESTGDQQASAERPHLGAMLCDLTDQEASTFEPQATEGALVWKLSPDSPASRAGIQAGDVIRMVNAREVKNAGEFIEAFSQLNSGDRLNLSIQRGRELRNISLVLAPLNASDNRPGPPKPPANQPTLPEGLEFSSPNTPLSYRHPKGFFQLQLPSGWAIHAGHRGRIEDGRFDTLLDQSGTYQVIIWRQSVPAEKGRDLLMQLGDLLGAEGLQYPAVGFGESVEGTNWSQLSIQYPETSCQVIYAAAIHGEQLWRFDFVSLSQPVDSGLPEPLRQVRNAIRFSDQPGPQPDEPTEPTTPDLPQDLVRLENVFDGQPRSFDLELIAAGTPEAAELEIESPAGAVVTEVRPRTVAAAAGLRRGDLIVQLDAREINTPEDVEAVVWTTPVNQMIQLAYARRDQRITAMLKIAAGEPGRAALGEYRNPTGSYGFNYFPTWRLHPNARREEVTERVYDYLSSRQLGFQLQLFHEPTPAPNAVASLQAFLEESSQGFLEGYSGWLRVQSIPVVFASGVVGREKLQTLYRLAFVVEGNRYELNAFTSGIYDPAELPLPLKAILGSLNKPE